MRQSITQNKHTDLHEQSLNRKHLSLCRGPLDCAVQMHSDLTAHKDQHAKT